MDISIQAVCVDVTVRLYFFINSLTDRLKNYNLDLDFFFSFPAKVTIRHTGLKMELENTPFVSSRIFPQMIPKSW